jgi:serine/threonine-protein kinase
VDGEDDPLVGHTIDGVKILRRLAVGARSVVYLAEFKNEHPCVLKILRPAAAGEEDTVERFFREAQGLAQLNHRGVPAIQNVGQAGDYYFLRMEYVEGETLEARVGRDGPLPWQAAAHLGAQVSETLAHIHEKGLVHRNVGPGHIILSEPLPKLTGYNLVKHAHSSAQVSVTGQIVGEPFWMSPERAGGKPTDARSDIYSLGVTLYYAVTGVRPFDGKNLQEIFLKHFFYAPESPKIYADSIPDELCDVVARCLKKKKAERFQSAKRLAHALAAIDGL